MSWLFDRLCAIAIEDRVEVVLATDVGQAVAVDAHLAADLVELLVRAAGVAQLTVTVASGGEPSLGRLGAARHAVEVDEIADDLAIALAGEMVRRMQSSSELVLRARGGTISLHEAAPGGADDAGNAAWHDGRTVVFATGSPGFGHRLRDAGRTGLGIAVGGVDPEAQVQVDGVGGVLSIVDALVTLRTFAFGGDRSRQVDRLAS
jgi:hypothetical protein